MIFRLPYERILEPQERTDSRSTKADGDYRARRSVPFLRRAFRYLPPEARTCRDPLLVLYREYESLQRDEVPFYLCLQTGSYQLPRRPASRGVCRPPFHA